MAETIRKVEKGVGVFTKAFAWVSVIATVVMMIFMLVDIVLRFVFSKPILGGYEIVTVMLAIIIFFAFGYTQFNKEMVHACFFMRKFPGLVPLGLWVFNGLVAAGIAALLAYASFVQTGIIQTLGQTTQTLYIPLFPFYMMMGIGFTVFTIALLFDVVKSVLAFFNKEIRDEVMENWPI